MHDIRHSKLSLRYPARVRLLTVKDRWTLLLNYSPGSVRQPSYAMEVQTKLIGDNRANTHIYPRMHPALTLLLCFSIEAAVAQAPESFIEKTKDGNITIAPLKHGSVHVDFKEILVPYHQGQSNPQEVADDLKGSTSKSKS